jgi:hypothetical protein
MAHRKAVRELFRKDCETECHLTAKKQHGRNRESLWNDLFLPIPCDLG